MKLYSNSPTASMAMHHDPELVRVLQSVPHTHILETGTYKGEGSSQMLLSLKPEVFITMEANVDCWTEARLRLPQSVDCVFGVSVDRNKAIEFIQNDQAIRAHELHPDIYIDSVDGPVEFYSNEINKVGPDNLLTTHIPKVANHNPIILLDSAGGIGLLEFEVACDLMGEKPFTLVLDDIHHLKHFRSVIQIQKDTRWTILYRSESSLVATFTPSIQKTIRLILGRYGDVFMVASKMPKTDILACNRKFSQIAKELFPEIELIELDEDDLAKAFHILKHDHPEHRVVACQQNGQSEELTLPFRSYQSFQEYYASVQ